MYTHSSSVATIFLGILSGLAQSRQIDEEIGNFVVDASVSLFSPVTISAVFCIDNDDSLLLSRRMSRRNVLHNVRKSLEGYDPTRLESQIDHRNVIVLDLDCHGADDILIQASQNQMFVAPAKWLLLQDLRKVRKVRTEVNTTSSIDVILKNDDLSWIYEKFRYLEILPDSEVILGRRMKNDLVRILSPYRPNPQAELILEDRGYWTPESGTILRNTDPASRRRRNLQQTALKSCLVITNTDTFNHLEDYQDKLVDAVTKANYPWILHLTRRMNATVNFTSQNTWGYRQKNGSWSGMIGLLERREIDLGGTATFITPDRIGVVDYIQLYTPTGSKFLFRRPPLSYVSNLFTLPFEASVWIAIGVLVVIVIGLLYLAMRWEYAMRSKEKIREPDWLTSNDEIPSFSNNLLVVIGAISQQGSSYEPRAVPTRIIVLMLLVCALSLYASYTANIVALLQSTATSINTLKDLMDSPMKIGIYDVVYNRYYFEAFEDEERKTFFEHTVKGKKGIWMNLQEGISRVRKGLFAFHVEVGAGYQLMQETFEENEKCGIHELDFLHVLNPLLIIQHRSPYLEIIRVGALWIRETGLQQREISRLYTDKPVCQGHNSFLSVGIVDCYAALMTMAYGTVATIGILVLEIMWNKWCSSREPNEIEVSE